jgi:thioredoxin:protein disulfide reductase
MKKIYIPIRAILFVLFVLFLFTVQPSIANQEAPPLPGEVFHFNAWVEKNTIKAAWTINEGYYISRQLFSFSLEDTSIKTGPAIFPKGKIKNDKYMGEMEIFRTKVVVDIPLLSQLPSKEIFISGTVQGCSDKGICYPPYTSKVKLALSAPDKPAPKPDSKSENKLDNTADNKPEKISPESKVSEQDRIAGLLSSDNLFMTLLTFYGFGLLLAFTPCIFPMIPILSGIIVGQGEKITTGRAFFLSLAYVLAMAVTYTGAGIFAGLFGQNIQNQFQNPWVLGSFSVVFVLLSLAMFGFYELQMPASIQTRLTNISNRQQGGTLIGASIMGFLSALIVGPCVAAPLAGVLIYISKTGDAILGGMALFILSIGMGTPLIIIGSSAGKLLPRAGMWMDAVKVFFGVMLLGVAILMLERIIDPAITMLLWAALAIIYGVHLQALDSLPVDSGNWLRFKKGLGFILLIIGVLILTGAASGNRDKFQPLAGFGQQGGLSVSSKSLVFKDIKGEQELKTELELAKSAGKTIMLDFTAEWCTSCKELEEKTFKDQAVIEALDSFILLRADVTENKSEDIAFLKHFNLVGPPALLFFTPQKGEVKALRIVGYIAPEKFIEHISSL